MEIKKALSDLQLFWENQNIKAIGKTIDSIKAFEQAKHIKLPEDFIEYFKTLNGMETLYPNDSDNNGFLFYPLEQLKFPHEKFGKADQKNKRLMIFIDYMQESWWYGFRILENAKYEIGIIPSVDIFKPITNSFSEFVEFYIHDNEILYNS
jgi:hypothetical protein